MDAKTFTYGGYTFEPQGQFNDYGIRAGKSELRDISRCLNYINAGYVADGDEKFDYDEFYKAADSDADVFFCLETGELYVPCAATLCVFDQTATGEEVERRYKNRVVLREEQKRLAKREALKNAMRLADYQIKAVNALREAAFKCRELGLGFAVNGTDMYVFRVDMLRDITSDMAPMNGQESIETGMHVAIENVWDAREGLYANPKEI